MEQLLSDLLSQRRTPRLLVTVEDARNQLSIGRTKFYEEVHRGRLVIVKAGGKSLVPQACIDAFVETLVAEASADRAA